MSANREHIVENRILSVQNPLSLRSVLEIVVFTIVLAFVLKLCVLDAIHIPSPSMEPTLLPGDFVLVNKLVYGARITGIPFVRTQNGEVHLPGFRSVERGDVVVFEPPVAAENDPITRSSLYVKRCVAVSGDEVAIRNGDLFVNGLRASVPETPVGGLGEGDNTAPVRVPKAGDRITLTSSNYSVWSHLINGEGHAIACTESGTVLIDGIPEKSYTITQDYLFVLGDNRDHSYDSRSWGFLPERNVLGEAMMVYLSFAPSGGVRWNRFGSIVR